MERILYDLASQVVPMAKSLVAAIIVAVVGFKFTNFVVRKLKERPTMKDTDPSTAGFIASFISIGLKIVVIVSVIAILGVPMSSVVALIASAGVAIGLAVQGALSNLVGGIMILLFRPFSAGDYIESNGAAGTVRGITVFYTVLVTPDNKIITMPNGDLTNSVITNYSTEDTRRVDLDFTVDYDADIQDVKNTMLSCLEGMGDSILSEPAPAALMKECKDNGILYTIRVWVKSENYWPVRFALLEAIRNAFKDKNIDIAYPQMDVHIKNKDKKRIWFMKNNIKLILVTVVLCLLFVGATVALVSNIGNDSSNYSSDVSQAVESSNAENSNIESSCADESSEVSQEPPVVEDPYDVAVRNILNNIDNLQTSFSARVDEEFITLIADTFGKDKVETLGTLLFDGNVTSEDMRGIFGYTEKAFLSVIDNDLYRTSVLENTENGVTDLVFVGDTSFADGYSVMNKYNSKGLNGLVSEDVLAIMRSATITMANNEFTFTTRGTRIPNKIWTFRGDPKNVSIYHEMGVDIVGMANNHAFDYGPDSLTDTLATLDGAGIAHVGAGENLTDAKAPYYYIVNGYKIAIVAGSAIDPYSTRKATDEQSGVFQIFDTVSMTNEISAAKENADYVIAYVHWGLEKTTNLTGGQKSMGKAFVDAGADVVVGMHSHCMQGVEYYNGKLICYSLGNFTFSSYTLTAGMLKVSISDEGIFTNTFYPLMHSSNYTYINGGEKGKSQLDSLKALSPKAVISDDFIVTEP